MGRTDIVDTVACDDHLCGISVGTTFTIFLAEWSSERDDVGGVI